MFASCSKLSSEISASDLYLDDSHASARKRLVVHELPPRTGPDLEYSFSCPSAIPTCARELSSNSESRRLMSELLESSAVLQTVLTELRVSKLSIQGKDVRRMVELVRKHLRAFAISPWDVGRAHLATH